MPVITIDHETVYRYDRPVETAHHLAHLRPSEGHGQVLEAFELRIEPVPANLQEDVDGYGNSRQFFSLHSPHQQLSVRAMSRVRLSPSAFAMPVSSAAWEEVRESLAFRPGRPFEPAGEFALPSPYVPDLPALHALAREVMLPGRPLSEAAVELMHRVHEGWRYQSEATAVDTPLSQVIEQRSGVCQDFAHLTIGVLRAAGLAARYVSGYLAAEAGAPAMLGAQASHAWVAVWCPGAPGSWLELDPTNAMLAGRAHVRLATGRDYGDVAPLRGVIRGGGRHTLTVQVRTAVVG